MKIQYYVECWDVNFDDDDDDDDGEGNVERVYHMPIIPHKRTKTDPTMDPIKMIPERRDRHTDNTRGM